MNKAVTFAMGIAFGLGILPHASRGDSSFGYHRHVPGEMEASFLVNLFRYVRWPHAPLESGTICFLRESDVQSRIQEGISHKEKWAFIPDRRVAIKMLSDEDVKTLDRPENQESCQILYLDSRTADELWPTFSISKMPPSLLTVSTQRDFAYHGGMIQFKWEDGGTYRILINPANVMKADIVISGPLATLADRVDDARWQIR